MRRKFLSTGRTLGELPSDLVDERQTRPPVMGSRPGHMADSMAIDTAWHGQDTTNFRVLVGTVSTLVVPYNARRSYLLIVNDAANAIRLGLSHGADLVTGLPIPAGGGFYEPILGTTSQVFAICTVANSPLIVVEGFYAGGPISTMYEAVKGILAKIRGG